MKKVFAQFLAFPGMMAAVVTTAFASSTPPATTVTSSDFAPVITAISSQLSVTTVVGILAWILGLTVGFFFMWWAVRKVVTKIQAAFQKGKMSV